MKIEEHIKAINTYFENKVIEGDYEVNLIGEHTVLIVIDLVYTFELWISNSPKDNFNFHDSGFVESVKPNLNTQKKRMQAYSRLKPFLVKHKTDSEIKEKTKQYNKLKKELNIK